MVYIEKDLPRTYNLHELFAEEGGLGQTEMKKVLKAYSIYNPKVGYCQVSNFNSKFHEIIANISSSGSLLKVGSAYLR